MKMKKLVALTMVTLFALLLVVPLASNTAAPTPLTPAATAFILPQQDSTPAKAIPTNPLGPYNLTDGEELYYTGMFTEMECFPMPDWYTDESYSEYYYFDYDNTTWGDWFIVDLYWEVSPYIAVHNQTREIGLNGTEVFESPPANDSVITRHTGVYSWIAIPTGVKAGDHIKIIMPIYPEEEELQQITFEVLGRITAPNSDMTEFYDTWVLHGTYTGIIQGVPVSVAFELGFETETGLLVSMTMGGSVVDPPYLIGWHVMMQYNSSLGEDSPAELPNTGIDYIYTAEEYLLPGTIFTYNESGYWHMDWSAMTGGSVGKVTLNSLDESYVNFTLEDVDGIFYVPFGISQNVKIPDSLWNYYGTWNPTYYNSTTQIGHLEDLLGLVIMDFTRWLAPLSPQDPINTMLMAPPWIRDGSVFLGITLLPLFWPDNSTPSFGPEESLISLLMPFRVSGAVPVVIDGNVYDCWKTELVIPTDLSDLNITQLQYEAYYERTSGILIQAKADMEIKIYSYPDITPVGYHKTWTLADSSTMIIPIPMSIKALPTPEEMSSYYNVYGMNFGADSLDTLDPSLFNGGSVTANFSGGASILMWTMTRLAGNVSIDGKPIVKFMNVQPDDSTPLNTATVNFYYTPSELWAMGAKESGFTVYAWNETAMAWELINTTWDADGRVVSADAEHFSVFALVASELTIFDILGPGGMLFLLNYLGQAANPMSGMTLPLVGLGIVLLIIAIIAAVILKKPK